MIRIKRIYKKDNLEKNFKYKVDFEDNSTVIYTDDLKKVMKIIHTQQG